MEKTEIELSTNLKEKLLADERVEWAGSSAPFPLVNALNKKNLLLRWLVTGAAFVILTVVYVLLSLRTAGFSIGVELVLLVIFGYIACTPLLDHNRVMKKCRYYVTDKRILTAVGYNEVFALGRAGLKLRAVPAEDGCVHLLFGAATELPEEKYQIRTFSPLKAENGEGIVGMVFYKVKDTPELRKLLNY